MNKEEFRAEWRSRWLNLIFDLTTIEYQRKTWLDVTGTYTSPYFSFIEFMCCYFDDLLVDSYQSCIDEGLVLIEEFGVMQEWHNLLDKYESPNNEDYNREAILKDTKWLEIVAIGKQARQKLEEILPPKEAEHLKQRENNIA
jgi:hypothetical protein